MKKLVVLTAVAGLGLTALSPAAAQAQSKPASIKWHACAAGTGLPDYKAAFPTLAKVTLQCATIKVPVDFRHPRGKKLTLALSRLKHTGKGKARHMLVNPGGPGGTGTDFAIAVAGRASAKLMAKYDIVGFDPRGTGGSGALSCDSHYFDPVRPDYNPKTKADIRFWLSKSKAYAKACGKKYGKLLNHIKTVDNVHDMDAIRGRLGDRKLDFYGASYGTYLGAVYASLFPRKVGRFTLDSNVDPRGVWYDANLEQDKAFDRNLNILWGWIAKHDADFHLGTSQKAVKDLYYKTRTELITKPVDVKIDGEQVKVGPDELDDTWLGAGYRASSIRWTDLARALAARSKGDDTGIATTFLTYGASSEDGYPVYTGTQCTDVQWPTSWKKWQADNTRLAKKYPFETWNNAWYNAPCLYWPAKAGRPVKITAKRGLPKILLFQATLDAATPFAGGPQLQKQLNAKLIIEDGGLTHGIVQRGNAPIDAAFEAFMLTGKLPKKRTTHVPSLGEPAVAPAATARTQGTTPGDLLLK
ncbi:alpha/beta hydrolase [Actinocorallia longicatena]|uniref:Alpha/beta hydrolase n=1 Tax=Actinocorallia longicatena TaxID=111803 RepID=A0ABP6Q132_9ACTN